MSTGAEEIRRIAERLGELSERLGNPELSDEQAEGLAKEASELAARGGGAIEEALRDLARRPTPEASEEIQGVPAAEPPGDG